MLFAVISFYSEVSWNHVKTALKCVKKIEKKRFYENLAFQMR